MADLDKSLEDPEYVLWVQAGTCVGFAKKGLESFVTQQSQVLHQRIKYNVKSKCQQQSSIVSMCANISVEKKQNRWRMNCYPSCHDCQLYLDELDTLRIAGFRFEKGNWNNSNIDIWPTSAWDMAKVYMNPGQDRNCQRAEDTDLSGILNFISHCTVPNMAIANNQNIKKVRDSRNAVMHSSTFKVQPQQFQDFTDAMIDLLEDQTRLCQEKDAIDAVGQIKEAKKSEFTITTDAEFRVLRDRALELQKENKTMQEKVKYMQDQCDDLEGKDDEQSQTTLAQLVKEIDEREKNLKELKSTFSKLEHFASRKRDLKAKMTEHTTVTATALYETKELLTNVKRSYRALTKQEQDIIDETTDQYETVEEKYDALQKLTEALITENKDMKAENLALCTSKTENENSLREKQQEIDDMKQTLQDCRKDNETIEQNLISTIAERDQLLSANHNLREKLDTLDAKQRMQDGLLNDLRLEKAKLETETKETKQKLDLSLKQIDTLSDKKRELESEIRNLKIQIGFSQTELESIKQKQAEYQAELQTLVSEKEELVADKLERDDRISKLQLQTSQLETALLQSQTEGKRNEKKIKKINEENNIMKLQIRELKGEIVKLKKKFVSASRENARLSTINDDLKLETEELKDMLKQYKDELESVKQETLNAGSEFQILYDELSELIDVKFRQDDEINTLREEKILLQTDLKEKQQKLDLSLCEIDILSNYKSKLELEIRNLKRQLEHNHGELESMKQKQAETQAKLQTLVSEKKELIADKLKRDNRISELHLQNTQLETALLQSRTEGKMNLKELERINEENNTLKSKIHDLNEEIKKVKQKLLSDVKKIDLLSTFNNNLESENNKVKEQLEQYQAEIAYLKHEKADAVSELEILLSEINDLIGVKLRQDYTMKVLQEKNSMLETNLHQMQIVSETTEKELKRLTDENYALKRQNQQLKQDINQSIQQLQKTVHENTHVKKKIENLNNKMQRIKKEKEDLQSDLEKQIYQLKSQKQSLSRKMQKLTYLNSRFKNDIDGVSGLKQQNDKLKRTDTTLFRIWCLSVTLYTIAFIYIKMMRGT